MKMKYAVVVDFDDDGDDDDDYSILTYDQWMLPPPQRVMPPVFAIHLASLAVVWKWMLLLLVDTANLEKVRVLEK